VFVVLNEVRYDPPGTDAGGEYIELYNPSETSVLLDSAWSLSRGNGARAGDWTVVWTGDGTEIPPEGFLVIGDDPRADRPAVLSLQNGPDAARLTGPGGAVDLVGWGEQSFPEYAEGDPAPDPPSGIIARRPDGVDTDDNARDWVEAGGETPGALNVPPRGLRVTFAFPPTEPSVLVEGAPFTVRLVLDAVGLEGLPEGTAGVRLEPHGTIWTLDRPLAPGTRLEITVPCAARSAGVDSVRAMSWGTSVDVAAQAVVLAGMGPLMLSEIQAAPAEDEPEWIELERVSSDLEPGAWTLVDAGGNQASFSPPRGGGAFLVVTRDRAALLGAYPELDPNIVLSADLPTLNDRDERVHVVAPGAYVSDSVAIDVAPETGTLERVHLALPSTDVAAWVRSPRGATPGAVNGAHARPKATEGLTVLPRIVGAHGCEIRVNAGEGLGDLEIVVVDLSGRRRGEVLVRSGASARTGLYWDGRLGDVTLEPGLYVLVARFRTDEGVRVIRTSFAVADDAS
jgi:hypothetical protein